MKQLAANINPASGIAFGYIAVNDLDSDLVVTLLYEVGEDHSWDEAVIDLAKDRLSLVTDSLEDLDDLTGLSLEEIEGLLDEHGLYSEYEAELEFLYIEEPLISGKYEGVEYITSWLGGALNFFITSSPHITNKACQSSPCVPNAGILKHPTSGDEGSVECYSIPDNWYCEELI